METTEPRCSLQLIRPEREKKVQLVHSLALALAPALTLTLTLTLTPNPNPSQQTTTDDHRTFRSNVPKDSTTDYKCIYSGL